jgi:hypothetical protein
MGHRVIISSSKDRQIPIDMAFPRCHMLPQLGVKWVKSPDTSVFHPKAIIQYP